MHRCCCMCIATYAHQFSTKIRRRVLPLKTAAMAGNSLLGCVRHWRRDSMSDHLNVLRLLDVVWPEHEGVQSLAKRAAAAHLILHPDRNSRSHVAQAVSYKLGATTQSLGLPPFQKLLLQDACFSITDAAAAEPSIRLNFDILTTTAESRISNLVDTVFPPSASIYAPAANRVKRAVAKQLMQQPNYKARSSLIASLLDKNIGSMAKLGISTPFRQVIASDPCFKLTPCPTPGDLYIKLDVKQLQQKANDLRAPAAAAAVTLAAPPASTATAHYPPPTITGAGEVANMSQTGLVTQQDKAASVMYVNPPWSPRCTTVPAFAALSATAAGTSMQDLPTQYDVHNDQHCTYQTKTAVQLNLGAYIPSAQSAEAAPNTCNMPSAISDEFVAAVQALETAALAMMPSQGCEAKGTSVSYGSSRCVYQ